MSVVLKCLHPTMVRTFPIQVIKKSNCMIPIKALGKALMKTSRAVVCSTQFPKSFHTFSFLNKKSENVQSEVVETVETLPKKKNLAYYIKSAPQVTIFYFGLYGGCLFSIYELLNFGIIDPTLLSAWLTGQSPKLGSMIASYPKSSLFAISYVTCKLTSPFRAGLTIWYGNKVIKSKKAKQEKELVEEVLDSSISAPHQSRIKSSAETNEFRRSFGVVRRNNNNISNNNKSMNNYYTNPSEDEYTHHNQSESNEDYNTTSTHKNQYTTCGCQSHHHCGCGSHHQYPSYEYIYRYDGEDDIEYESETQCQSHHSHHHECPHHQQTSSNNCNCHNHSCCNHHNQYNATDYYTDPKTNKINEDIDQLCWRRKECHCKKGQECQCKIAGRCLAPEGKMCYCTFTGECLCQKEL
ncbi:hypothetical protein WA158_006447 [Blastocystis sp. Blastoise]